MNERVLQFDPSEMLFTISQLTALSCELFTLTAKLQLSFEWKRRAVRCGVREDFLIAPASLEDQAFRVKLDLLAQAHVDESRK